MGSRSTPRDCVCGASYVDFRTGETFVSVRKAMFDDPHPDTGKWRSKRRHGVLGYWREIKIHMWEFVHGYCEEMLDAA